MRVARFAVGGRTLWGPVDGDWVRDASEGGRVPIEDLFAADDAGVQDRLGRPGPEFALASVRLLAPVARPSKVIAIGLNYLDHAREAGLPVPAAPLMFAKYPSSIIGPGDAIVLPEVAPACVDWEAELAVVIGRAGRGIAEADALDHVFGYTVANDVSARDLQRSDGQWVRAKSFDTFCPLGPWITTRDELGDASGLPIRLEVNGVRKQSSTTSELIAGVRRLIAACSAVATLEPGDVIVTGTPPGTGDGRTPKEYLAPGDTVRIEIGGIGVLENPVAG